MECNTVTSECHKLNCEVNEKSAKTYNFFRRPVVGARYLRMIYATSNLACQSRSFRRFNQGPLSCEK